MTAGRSSAVAKIQHLVLCASYSRVSTENQADKEFNSIELQRDSCETYINLHSDDGWLVGEHYQDVGFSGSNTSRPDLQRLLADIEAGKIKVVVVYKFDRLSRSMLDFLQMLDFFKRHQVSFVSVSQRFDTSTPVGEMMLNILLSFAQFERQIITERTRDKIRAARRKGKYTGGTVPFGYQLAPEGGRLVVDGQNRSVLRMIFRRYLELGFLTKLAEELNRLRIRHSCRRFKAWNRVNLHRLLTNCVYVGLVKQDDQLYRGEHRAIVSKRLFDQVQKLMAENRRDGGAQARNRYGALLRGLLRCAACDAAMSHAASKRNEKVHRRYVCIARQKRGAATCPTKPIPADKIEAFVVDQIRRIGTDLALQEETFRQALAQVKAQQRGLRLEAKTIKKDLARVKENVERLTRTLSRTEGPAGDAIAGELGKAQELLTTLQSREAEIQTELEAIKSRDINRDDLAKVLEAFDPIWDVLLTPEKERVLRLLIEKIDYDGGTGEMAITWRLSGFGELAAKVAP